MTWSELERLVEDAEADGDIRRALRHCRSRHELVLAAQRLGYGIAAADLQQVWELHRQVESAAPLPDAPQAAAAVRTVEAMAPGPAERDSARRRQDRPGSVSMPWRLAG